MAELLAVLSLAADLGMGQPMEHVLRQCLICLRLARHLGLAEADQEVVYYTALVAWVGCHVDAYEQAKWFGDDTVLKADFRQVDFTGLAGPLFMLRHLGAGRPLLERATARGPSRGRTGPQARPGTQRPSCGPRYGRAGSTGERRKRCCRPPVTGPPAGPPGPPD